MPWVTPVDDRSIAIELEELVPGRLVDPTRFTRDSSIFELLPEAAVRPTSETDILRILSVARRHKRPVVARAGGSNTGGAAITDGVLLLFDQPEFATITVDASSGCATCGPSVRHDALQRKLREHGRWLPSDPSSGPLSYVGGNINTRASGPHALRHGAIHNYLRHVRIITGAGETVDTRDRTTLPPRLRDGLFELARTLRHDTEMLDRLELRRSFKWASGYELLALADHGDDPVAALPRLVAGSVGTLGILTEAVLASEPLPSERGALLVRFASAQAACRAAGSMRTRAAAIEIVSRSALDLLRRHTDVLAGDDESAALLIVEYSGPGALESVERAARALDARDLVGEPVRASTDDEIDAIWAARKALLPVVRRYASTGFVPYSVVNDVGVAPERLGELLAGAEEIFDRYGLDAPIYGHAGSGNLHLRPLFPTGNRELVARVANDVYGLVCRLGGTVTAEHGMGRLRAPFLRAEWGDRIVDLMTEVKRLFDPDGLLNPGVMVPARDGEAGTPPWGGDLRL